ncbi:hypothetical protein RUM44_013839 [Polyplax serrata]|uniref:Uncharacterized protein n=1 Tax=Polyplax serrata TaxID=468196 RepID=A0ABR1BFB0_POLSC
MEPGSDSDKLPEMRSCAREFGRLCQSAQGDRPRDTHAQAQAQACTQTPVVPVFSSSRKLDIIKAKNEEEKIIMANEKASSLADRRTVG